MFYSTEKLVARGKFGLSATSFPRQGAKSLIISATLVMYPDTMFPWIYCVRGKYMHYIHQSFAVMAHWGKSKTTLHQKQQTELVVSREKTVFCTQILGSWHVPNGVLSLLTLNNWTLSFLLTIRRDRENEQISRMTERASVTDFAEKNTQQWKLQCDNRGAAGWTARTNPLWSYSFPCNFKPICIILVAILNAGKWNSKQGESFAAHFEAAPSY